MVAAISCLMVETLCSKVVCHMGSPLYADYCTGQQCNCKFSVAVVIRLLSCPHPLHRHPPMVHPLTCTQRSCVTSFMTQLFLSCAHLLPHHNHNRHRIPSLLELWATLVHLLTRAHSPHLDKAWATR